MAYSDDVYENSDSVYGMQVCVNSAAIIASLITGLAEAELIFFNDKATLNLTLTLTLQ